MKLFLFLIFVAILNPSISEPISNLSEQCEGIIFEAFPHPSDSHSFIGCIHGEASVFHCPNGEFFDELSVSCTKESEEHENERLKKACKDHKNKFVAHPDNCVEYLYCDEKEKPHVRECDEGHIFNPAEVQCWPGNAETCEFESDDGTNDCSDDSSESCETEEPVETTKGTTARPPNSEIRFTCPLEGEGLIPHPRDCTRYTECVNGQGFVRQCDEGLHFDMITSSCRDPDDGFCAINIQCI